MGFLNRGRLFSPGGCGGLGSMIPYLAVAALSVARVSYASEGLSVTSDTLEMDQKRQVAIFTGNVVADDGSMHLTSEKMTVYYSMKSSAGGGGNVREVKVDGNVVLTQGESRGTGQHAVYNVPHRTLELIGGDKEASIYRGKDHVMGKRILLTLGSDMRIDRMSVQGGDKKRVSARITPSGKVESGGVIPDLSGGKAASGGAARQHRRLDGARREAGKETPPVMMPPAAPTQESAPAPDSPPGHRTGPAQGE
ncbi:MAG: hypothetical protein HQL73_07340 [Magnetococcales bacterium]|nr:hypothetical protein [Magnetococcales bacterium]